MCIGYQRVKYVGQSKSCKNSNYRCKTHFYITLPFTKHLYPEIDPMKRTILLLVWWTVYIYSMLSLIFWLFEINRSILDSLWLILYISKIILFDDWCVTIMNWWMILIHIVSPRHKIMSNDYHAIRIYNFYIFHFCTIIKETESWQIIYYRRLYFF